MSLEALKTLLSQGLTLDQAAESLSISFEAASFMLQASTKKSINVDEMLDEFKPTAIRLLMDIAEHGESEAARVKALQILLTGSGKLPEEGSVNIQGRLDRMKQILGTVQDIPGKDAEPKDGTTLKDIIEEHEIKAEPIKALDYVETKQPEIWGQTLLDGEGFASSSLGSSQESPNTETPKELVPLDSRGDSEHFLIESDPTKPKSNRKSFKNSKEFTIVAGSKYLLS